MARSLEGLDSMHPTCADREFVVAAIWTATKCRGLSGAATWSTGLWLSRTMGGETGAAILVPSLQEEGDANVAVEKTTSPIWSKAGSCKCCTDLGTHGS